MLEAIDNASEDPIIAGLNTPMKKSLCLLPLLSMLTACEVPNFFAGDTEASHSQVEIASATQFETITRVVDGDTLEIAAEWSPYPLEWRVRILGIDTPEKGSRARCTRERELSAQAQAMTERMVRETLNRVRLRNVRHDAYGGRLDADVIMANGRSMGEELLRAGLARRYNGNGPKPNWCS